MASTHGTAVAPRLLPRIQIATAASRNDTPRPISIGRKPRRVTLGHVRLLDEDDEEHRGNRDPDNQPPMNEKPLAAARGQVRSSRIAAMGIGLNAIPIA